MAEAAQPELAQLPEQGDAVSPPWQQHEQGMIPLTLSYSSSSASGFSEAAVACHAAGGMAPPLAEPSQAILAAVADAPEGQEVAVTTLPSAEQQASQPAAQQVQVQQVRLPA